MTDQANNFAPAHRPVALIILDGWGIGRDEPGNAVLAARTPTMDRIWTEYPHTTLITSGEAVGLPAGQMGNSEVGHLNLGAGFIVYQWITRIDVAIADGSFNENAAILAAIDRCLANGSTLHLMGLVSNGGVHSHTRHLVAILKLAAAKGLTRVAIHAFTDGRDTAPQSGLGIVTALELELAAIGSGRIATVSGRYYAMDRDNRWARTQLAYDAIVSGKGEVAGSAAEAIQRSYDAGTTDEFVLPTIIGVAATLEPGDAVISFNYRSDRMRQLIAAISEPGFDGFERSRFVDDLEIVTMTRYEEGLPVTVAFAPKDVEYPIARIVSEAGLKQFHAAETEKYPHVTFFFNGGREEPFPGEERALVPSPKVATYDLQPEMSAAGVTDAVVGAIESGTVDFIIVNFANCDMVGHTGVFDAAVQAVETADTSLARVLAALDAAGGVALVTADHGNAEEMIDRVTGGPMTAHTTNPVPIVLVVPAEDPLRNAKLRSGAVLSSVAPTLLQFLGVAPPESMEQPSRIESIGKTERDRESSQSRSACQSTESFPAGYPPHPIVDT
ncbi:2,3-bisphosphoglycerate-independent phosphoglycerate mutase [soil metagenome]